MTSRAEIEAQILALKAILKEKEIDPDFTPKELVRWDPSLIGTILHMKHPISMPRFILDNCNCNTGYYNCSNELEMEQFCALTYDGILVNDDVTGINNPCNVNSLTRRMLNYNLKNDFRSMTTVPLWLSQIQDMKKDMSIIKNTPPPTHYDYSGQVHNHDDLVRFDPKWTYTDLIIPSLNDLGVKLEKRIREG